MQNYKNMDDVKEILINALAEFKNVDHLYPETITLDQLHNEIETLLPSERAEINAIARKIIRLNVARIKELRLSMELVKKNMNLYEGDFDLKNLDSTSI